jgi:S-adenosylmethionine-diacylglycerol 3-amino-3-carboxypropyl transferase
MRSVVIQRAASSEIRYSQCWEDADILLEALNIQSDTTCLSIASAGDNTLAMLSRRPRRVIAIDRSAAQLAVLELRVAAFRELKHAEVLALHGSVESHGRQELYERCRRHLSNAARDYWDRRLELIEVGFGSAGRLERYFRLFRSWVLPFAESRGRIEQLLTEKSSPERVRFYDSEWNNLRWRVVSRIFCSRLVMGRLGRGPELFRYVEGEVAGRILERTRYAMTKLDPAVNPYLCWILTGRHRDGALPFSLRAENFEAIRGQLDRLEWRCCSLEEFLESPPCAFDAFNLSDIFEYQSAENYEQLLCRILHAAKPNARLAYWNLLVPRRRPEALGNFLTPLKLLSDSLFARDKAFFYGSFVVEEVVSKTSDKSGANGLDEIEAVSVCTERRTIRSDTSIVRPS